MNHPREDHEVAKTRTLNLIATYAPDEIEIANLIWIEQDGAPAEIDLSDEDTFLGIGLEIAGATLISAVIIPVVVAALEHAGKRTVDLVFDALKKRVSKSSIELSDEQIRLIASEIHRISVEAKAA